MSVVTGRVFSHLHPSPVGGVFAQADDDLGPAVAVQIAHRGEGLTIGIVVRRPRHLDPRKVGEVGKGIVADLQDAASTWSETDHDLVAAVTVQIAQEPGNLEDVPRAAFRAPSANTRPKQRHVGTRSAELSHLDLPKDRANDLSFQYGYEGIYPNRRFDGRSSETRELWNGFELR